MSKKLTLLTKADLIALGFSEYLVREVCKGLNSVPLEKGIRGYAQTDLKDAIITKLSQAKTKPQTRENLQVALRLMSDKSNVIEVDFLKKFSWEERISFLRDYRERLRLKGEEILQDVDTLLEKAKKLT